MTIFGHGGISKKNIYILFTYLILIVSKWNVYFKFHGLFTIYLSTPIIKSIIVVGFKYYNSLRLFGASLIVNFLVKLILSYSWRLMSHLMKKTIFCFPHPKLLLLIQNPVWFQWTGSRLKKLTHKKIIWYFFQKIVKQSGLQ